MKIALTIGSLALLTSLAAHAYGTPKPPAPQPTPELTQVITNDENERLVADANGKTLYTFDIDAGQTSSACNGDCAEIWPPYLLSTDEAAKLAAPLGAIVRANKKTQLTYEGKPVYTYAFDRVKGDDHGDGIGGVWHYIELE